MPNNPNHSTLTATLADTQEAHAAHAAILYRLYTEDVAGAIYDCNGGNIGALVARYFSGATILPAVGLWQRRTENSVVIEILGTLRDLQMVIHLAGDIKQENAQSFVLVTWIRVSRLDV